MTHSYGQWQKTTIGQLGRVVTGRTPTSSRPELFGDEYPFITPTDMEFDRVRISTERFLSSEGCSSQTNLLLPKEAVCFCCIGATIGKICMTARESFTNQQINSVIVNTTRHDPYFVFSLLRILRTEIAGIASGAATPIVNKTSFSAVEVTVPLLDTQRKIAGVMSAYDDLIENNTRRMAILEELAQSIYREWFVHFRYPGHEHTPLVDSPLGKIPHGWNVEKVKTLAKRVAVSDHYTQSDVTPIGTIPVFDQSTAELMGYHDNAADLEASPVSPVIIFGDHTCKMELVITPFSIGPNVIPFKSATDISIHYLYCLVNSLVATKEYKRHWSELTSKEVVVCTGDISREFAEAIEPAIEAIDLYRKKNRNLRKTRDLLLPKLISGQLDVADLDIDTGEPLVEADA